VVSTVATAAGNVGFLTVVREGSGYAGGYLVTNQWGRPLEFRLSTAVQPNRVQQILYGDTLEPYLCADLIGKALVEKASTPVQVIVTDRRVALELRWRIDTPMVWLARPEDSAVDGSGPDGCRRVSGPGLPPVFHHDAYPADAVLLVPFLARLCETLDLAEPFSRVREAMTEARNMGATSHV
jgi:hypothetical protein